MVFVTAHYAASCLHQLCQLDEVVQQPHREPLQNEFWFGRSDLSGSALEFEPRLRPAHWLHHADAVFKDTLTRNDLGLA